MNGIFCPVCGPGYRFGVEGCNHAAPNSTPTEREAEFHCDICGSSTHDTMVHDPSPVRVRFPKSVGNATVDMETALPTEREAGDVGEVAAVLASHRVNYHHRNIGPEPVTADNLRYTSCEGCEWLGGHRDEAGWETHLADALAPLIAERERAAGARALREAADAFGHYWQADMVPAPVVYRALRDRADRVGGER